MPEQIAGQILSTVLAKPVFFAKNEGTNLQVWQGLKVASVEIRNSSANTEHPMIIATSNDAESFSTLIDKDLPTVKIIQPSSLHVNALCDDLSTLENILTDFDDVTATFQISTKSIIATGMVFNTLEIEQSPAMLTASKITMSFEQVELPEFADYNPEQAGDASTYGISIQSPQTVSLSGSSLLQGLNNFQYPPFVIKVAGALIDQLGGPFILDSSMLA